MQLDKDLYRKAYELHRQWNEAEKIERARNAGQLSPEEAWRQYVDLVEFCWRLCPEQSQRQREQKLIHLNRYYDRVQKLEAWRRAHDQTT
jgi:hypothetical protein